MKSWIEVDQARLAENYRAALKIIAREAVAGQQSGLEQESAAMQAHAPALLAVIKANAYGHGATACAPILAHAGAEWLGVTDVQEGVAVKAALTAAGIDPARQPQILIMCGQLAADAPDIVAHGLVPVVWSQAQMAALAEAAGPHANPGTVVIHLEIDSGMSRQGVAMKSAAVDSAPGKSTNVAALRELLRWLRTEPRLRLDGVLTHFASAEVAGSEQTAAQRERFEAALDLLVEEGFRPACVHVGNTSAIDNGANGNTPRWLAGLARRIGARALIREGLGLYGYCLPLMGLVASDGDAAHLHDEVRPVMTWKTRILDLSEVPAGARIGYGGTFVASHPMRLALLPVGYADGLRRELSCSTWNIGDCSTWNTGDRARGDSGGWVMLHGQRAPIVGRISMNLTTVDVTGIDAAAVGHEATLLGDGVTAEDHAALAGTIAYEILCGVRAPVILV